MMVVLHTSHLKLFMAYHIVMDLLTSQYWSWSTVSSHETESQLSFTDPTSFVVNFSLKRLLPLQFSPDFDQTWYI